MDNQIQITCSDHNKLCTDFCKFDICNYPNLFTCPRCIQQKMKHTQEHQNHLQEIKNFTKMNQLIQQIMLQNTDYSNNQHMLKQIIIQNEYFIEILLQLNQQIMKQIETQELNEDSLISDLLAENQIQNQKVIESFQLSKVIREIKTKNILGNGLYIYIKEKLQKIYKNLGKELSSIFDRNDLDMEKIMNEKEKSINQQLKSISKFQNNFLKKSKEIIKESILTPINQSQESEKKILTNNNTQKKLTKDEPQQIFEEKCCNDNNNQNNILQQQDKEEPFQINLTNDEIFDLFNSQIDIDHPKKITLQNPGVHDIQLNNQNSNIQFNSNNQQNKNSEDYSVGSEQEESKQNIQQNNYQNNKLENQYQIQNQYQENKQDNQQFNQKQNNFVQKNSFKNNDFSQFSQKSENEEEEETKQNILENNNQKYEIHKINNQIQNEILKTLQQSISQVNKKQKLLRNVSPIQEIDNEQLKEATIFSINIKSKTILFAFKSFPSILQLKRLSDMNIVYFAKLDNQDIICAIMSEDMKTIVIASKNITNVYDVCNGKFLTLQTRNDRKISKIQFYKKNQVMILYVDYYIEIYYQNSQIPNKKLCIDDLQNLNQQLIFKEMDDPYGLILSSRQCISIINTMNNQKINQVKEKHTIKNIEISQNNQIIATYGISQIITFYKYDNEKNILQFMNKIETGHLDEILSVKFMNDDKWIVTISGDCSWKVFDFKTGENKYSNIDNSQSALVWCEYFEDENRLLFIDQVGIIKIYKLI